MDIELSSLNTLIKMAQRGYGAAFVTRAFVKNELAYGKLFELQLFESIPERSVSLATRRDITLSLAASRFVEMLLDSLKNI